MHVFHHFPFASQSPFLCSILRGFLLPPLSLSHSHSLTLTACTSLEHQPHMAQPGQQPALGAVRSVQLRQAKEKPTVGVGPGCCPDPALQATGSGGTCLALSLLRILALLQSSSIAIFVIRSLRRMPTDVSGGLDGFRCLRTEGGSSTDSPLTEDASMADSTLTTEPKTSWDSLAIHEASFSHLCSA